MRRGAPITRLIVSVPFAVGVAVVLIATASAISAATEGTPHRLAGAIATGLAVGLSGMYVGTVVRVRRKRRGGG